jgi:hypothetical protein
MPVSSDAIALSRFTAGRRNACVWVCRAVSAVAWRRCHLLCRRPQDIKSSLPPYLATVRTPFEFRSAGGRAEATEEHRARPARRRGLCAAAVTLLGVHNWAVWVAGLGRRLGRVPAPTGGTPQVALPAEVGPAGGEGVGRAGGPGLSIKAPGLRLSCY